MHGIRAWLPAVAGRSVLDAGCGDGSFLAKLLDPAAAGRPLAIRLEDLTAANLNLAMTRLNGRADVVEAAVHDSCATGRADGHDVVLAVGMLDYWPDWPQRLAHLVSRSRALTVATLPVPSGLHYRTRRLWLARHRISLPRITRHDLHGALAAIGYPYRVQHTRLEWIVAIDSSPHQTAMPHAAAGPCGQHLEHA